MYIMKALQQIYIFEKPNPYEGMALIFEERMSMGRTGGGRLRISTGLTNSKMLIPHLRIVSISQLDSTYKVQIIKNEFIRIGGLNDVLKALLDNDTKGISNQERLRLIDMAFNSY